MKRSVRFVSVVVLLGAVGLLLLPGQAQQAAQPTGTVPPGIIVKSPGESDIQIGVQVGPGPHVAGQQVEKDFITLSLNKQAVVYLLLINPEKEITVGGVTSKVREVRLLFPNRDFQGNFLQKGAYKFPGPGLWERPFEILGPPGTAYVQVIATPIPIGLESRIFEEPFPVLNNSPELVKADIERRLQQKGLRPADWTATWTQYGVLRSVPLTPQPTGNLKVKVVEQTTLKELDGAHVSVAGTVRAITDSLGKADVTHLLPGKYEVTVSRNGYKSLTKTDISIVAGRDTTEIFGLEPLPPRAVLIASRTEAEAFDLITFDASKSSGPILLYEWDWQSDGIIDHRTRGHTVIITPGGAKLPDGPSKVTLIVVFDDATYASDATKIFVRGPVLPEPGPGEPGTSVSYGTGVKVNPGTLELSEGKIRFVAIHSGYSTARQHGVFQVDRKDGKWLLPATLTFDYNFQTLPVREVSSFVRLVFYEFNKSTQRWECVLAGRTPDETSDDANCEGTKKLYEVRLPPPADLGKWFSVKHQISIPHAASRVIVIVELEVTKKDNKQPVKIEYRSIELSSK